MRRIWSSSSSASTADSARGGGFDLTVIEERAGFVMLRASGPKVWDTFQHESGGHRWQRVPPTEKRGRVHSSTITVAVLPEPTPTEVALRESDLEEQTCRSSGAGGQHVNKTNSAVILTHIEVSALRHQLDS